MRPHLKTAFIAALVATTGFASAAPSDAEARSKPLRKFAKLIKSGKVKSIDFAVSIQAGRKNCSTKLDQNADLNIGIVVQRCRNNSADIRQNGRFNRSKVRQR